MSSNRPSLGIIGTGKIGKELTKEFIRNNTFETIYISNRNKEKLSGVKEELGYWIQLEGFKTPIELFDLDQVSIAELNKIDYIIISIKENYDPRHLITLSESEIKGIPFNLRYVGLKYDLPHVKLISQKLRGYSGTIFVMSNPVDLFTYYIKSMVPTAEVLGLGPSLDSVRFGIAYNSYAKQHHNFQHHENFEKFCRAFVLLGEHGNGMKPVSAIWKENEMDYILLQPNLFNDLLDEVMKMGVNIVNNVGYTLEHCITIFSKDVNWHIDIRNNKVGLHPYNCFSVPKLGKGATGMPFSVEYVERQALMVEFKGLAQLELDFINESCSKNFRYFEILNQL